MGYGGGQQSSDSSQYSSNRPLNAAERSDIYNGALKNLSQALPGIFTAHTTPGSGGSQFYVDGDGNMVFNPAYTPDVTTYSMDNPPQYEAPAYQSPGAFKSGGYTAGLDYAKGKDLTKLDSDLAKRGIWSSGLSQRAINDLNSAYAGAYEKAGSDQATAENSYNLQSSGTLNTFNLQNAVAKNQSAWAPLSYLAGIWSGTGGQTGSSMGSSISGAQDYSLKM